MDTGDGTGVHAISNALANVCHDGVGHSSLTLNVGDQRVETKSVVLRNTGDLQPFS